MTGEARELSGVSFYKGTNPIHGGSALMTLSVPKGPTSKYHHLAVENFNI